MFKKMLFILNPKAGKKKNKNKLIDVLNIFIQYGYIITIYLTQKRKDTKKIINDNIKNYNILVISGGDGTVNEIVIEIIKRNYSIPIGYIPCGSTNDFANSLHISKNMINAAKNIINGNINFFDIGKFNNSFFVYVAAFGLFTDIAYKTNQNLKNIFGHIMYVLNGTQKIFNIKSYNIIIESDNYIIDGDFIFGMISNSKYIGGFQKLTYLNVELNDGKFEVMLIYKPKNIVELNKIITSLLSNVSTKLIKYFKSSYIKIFCKNFILWTIDGEFGGKYKQVSIKNIKQMIKIITHNN